ncbi:hypothetical protein SAMN05421846_10178 [Chryseobacterium taeanense]|uniref:Lipoprotein n=1 Tax=Chryseobacterium taeanense TaxID=311334 RepID=A0A1G8D7Q0_9FLAO|nr:hypothetical protein [Chryseobacterium taeanense]SDH53762.1 hypothetical protein SAMN05421846_10178 [Chryseobacterium taeanense]
MKNFLTALAISVLMVSCSKKETTATPAKTDSTKIVDSINAARTKINDSIKSKNHFKDFSGTHKFTHNSIKGSGTVEFKKIDGEADHYNVTGDIKSGKDYLHMNGFMAVVSEKHMNFTGNISESISENDNGKPYIRKGTKTFMSKDGGKTYRLQDMVNGSGFVEYIDIHF